MSRRKSKNRLTLFPWKHIYQGLLILVLSGCVCMIPKPVPDTKGVEFLFSTGLCTPSSPAEIFVIPQTTEAVNVTIISLENKVYTIPKGGVLRQQLPCTHILWNDITQEGIYIKATREVTLYVEYPDESHWVFPLDTLGSEYVVMCTYFPEVTETFAIIIGNDTNVEVHIPSDFASNITFQNYTYTAGMYINVTLIEYETVAISCNCDLTGARIISKSPINVFVGSKNTENKLLTIDQLPPTNTWGKRFLWASHPWIGRNVTLMIMGRHEYTTITVILKEATMKTSLSVIPRKIMQLDVNDFMAIESNGSVLCAICYDVFDSSGERHMTFKFLTPLLLYHVSNTFAFPKNLNSELSANIILTANSYQYVTLNSTSNGEFSKKPMTFYWNYFICKNVPFENPLAMQTSDRNRFPFYSNVLRRTNTSVYDYSLSMRITGIYDKCVKASRAHGGNGDGVDNDCDNRIDEERLNNVDDDGDHLVDEDIWYSGVIKPSGADMAMEYFMKNKEIETGISTSVISVILSIVVSIMSVGCFIGGMLVADRIRQVVSGTRVNPIINER